jgi:hypothetical protein
LCIHGLQKHGCKDCPFAIICEHDLIQRNCTKCKIFSNCMHGQAKITCSQNRCRVKLPKCKKASLCTPIRGKYLTIADCNHCFKFAVSQAPRAWDLANKLGASIAEDSLPTPVSSPKSTMNGRMNLRFPSPAPSNAVTTQIGIPTQPIRSIPDILTPL